MQVWKKWQKEWKLHTRKIKIKWSWVRNLKNSSWGTGSHRNGDERWTQQRNRRRKHQNSTKTLKINNNQVSIDLKKKQTEIAALKKGSRKSNMRCEVRKEERRNEAAQCRKRGWQLNENRIEQSKKLDK